MSAKWIPRAIIIRKEYQSEFEKILDEKSDILSVNNKKYEFKYKKIILNSGSNYYWLYTSEKYEEILEINEFLIKKNIKTDMFSYYDYKTENNNVRLMQM